MKDQLPMFDPETSPDIPSVISSPAAGFGASLFDGLDGPTIGQCGQAVAPAPASARQDKAEGLETLVTSGRIGWDSLESVALQSSLESRLVPRLDTAGSTLFRLSWKRRRTPLGRRYLERQASVRLTSGRDFTSLPTPQASDMTGGGQAKRAMMSKHPSGAAMSSNLNDYAMLAHTATPQTRDYFPGHTEEYVQKTRAQGHGVCNLNDQALLASTATPKASDGQGGRTVKTSGGGNSHLDIQARLASIATPRVNDAEKGGHIANISRGGLVAHALLASLPTPTQQDGASSGALNYSTESGRHSGTTLTDAANLASVATPRSEDSQCAGAHRGVADGLHSQALLASVPTPNTLDTVDRPNGLRPSRIATNRKSGYLTKMAALAAVATPSATEARQGYQNRDRGKKGSQKSLSTEIIEAIESEEQLAQRRASGPTATGGGDGTASGGQLNPAYSRWLMGVPPEWDDFVYMAMRSVSRRRKSSSKAIAKQETSAKEA